MSFHPEFQYSAVKFGSEYYIVAKGLIMQIENAVGRDNEQEIEIPAADVRKLKVYHPFIDRESKVIFGTHVHPGRGHSASCTPAPGHGHEDYIVGLEYGLDRVLPPWTSHGPVQPTTTRT